MAQQASTLPRHPASWAKLAILLAASLAVASIGALVPPDAWFRTLLKPTWNPPNALFGPVWSALYALMALAAWRVWRLPATPERNHALAAYAAQLLVNALWTPLFFGLHLMTVALADLLLLDTLVAATIILFRRLDRLASWLLLPYLGWILFATGLNAAIVWLNQ